MIKVEETAEEVMSRVQAKQAKSVKSLIRSEFARRRLSSKNDVAQVHAAPEIVSAEKREMSKERLRDVIASTRPNKSYGSNGRAATKIEKEVFNMAKNVAEYNRKIYLKISELRGLTKKAQQEVPKRKKFSKFPKKGDKVQK